MVAPADAPHLPHQAPIDAYGGGGFRFAGMSHRGSLLCLPSGIWAWPVTAAEDIAEPNLAPLFAEAEALELFVLGSGPDLVPLPEAVRWRLRDYRIGVEVMATGAAVRTYNILIGENRRVAAGLIAVG